MKLAHDRSRPCRTRLARVLTIALMCSLLPGAALGADEATLAQLRAELQRLELRIAELEAAAATVQPEPASNPPVSKPRAAAALDVEAGPGLELETSDGGAFSIGGRIHFDAYANDSDQRTARDGTEFRRARLSIDGEAAGWGYRVQLEKSGNSVDLRDAYVERELGSALLTVGQFKPFRSLEELTSSNDLSAMERGFTSGSGLFSQRQWQQGVGLLQPLRAGGIGVSAFSLREDNSPRNEGWGSAARATWAPLHKTERVVHLGLWGSYEHGGEGTPAFDIEAAYGGRRGPSALLFAPLGGGDFRQRSAGIEFAGRLRSFHWQSEWARADLDGLHGTGRLEAAYLQAGYVFGGGGRDYDLAEGVFGDFIEAGERRWEAIARIDRIRLRDAAGIEARRWVLGINRYLSDEVRLMLNWTQGEDLASGDEPGQLGLRVQYVF